MKLEIPAARSANYDNGKQTNAGYACQKIEDLIAAYRADKKRLEAVVEQDEFEQIKAADQSVTLSFDALLGATPRNRVEAVQLTDSLLNEVIPMGHETDLNSRVKTKILDLVSSSHAKTL